MVYEVVDVHTREGVLDVVSQIELICQIFDVYVSFLWIAYLQFLDAEVSTSATTDEVDVEEG